MYIYATLVSLYWELDTVRLPLQAFARPFGIFGIPSQGSVPILDVPRCLRRGSCLTWDNYVNAFMECEKCDRVILADKTIARLHVCAGSEEKLGTPNDRTTQLDSDAICYPGMSVASFREAFVQCGWCKRVWLREAVSTHSCTSAQVIMGGLITSTRGC